MFLFDNGGENSKQFEANVVRLKHDKNKVNMLKLIEGNTKLQRKIANFF